MLEKVKELCDKNGITQKELEVKLGFGKKSLTNWRSHAPNIDSVIAVADYFGVPLDYICGREVETYYLNDKEKRFIDVYRSLNDNGKLAIETMVEGFARENLYNNKSLNIQEA